MQGEVIQYQRFGLALAQRDLVIGVNIQSAAQGHLRTGRQREWEREFVCVCSLKYTLNNEILTSKHVVMCISYNLHSV